MFWTGLILLGQTRHCNPCQENKNNKRKHIKLGGGVHRSQVNSSLSLSGGQVRK